ncbi:mitochondrial 54S ribosomal protein uL15m MRPL10 [Sporobolomyces salmoneus]|uniref:mitochondrial 54S ribosomal protein uL15m MRPL10 n=1 Tax=Sporobolomyces salmoneus TaxID=183962 RepID=UPI00317A3AB4
MSLTRLVARLNLGRSTWVAPAAFSTASPISSTSSSSSSSRSTRQYATHVSTLGNLSPAPGSNHNRKRIGRGIGSGRGGTSGRGHKGQGARSGNGKPKLHFAGGQTPITRAFPKRGFKNPSKQDLVPLNLERLQHWIDKGLIDPTRPITMKELYETRCVHGVHDGVKILGDGAQYLSTPNLQIEASKASQTAIKAIEALNGTFVARYENRLTLRALIRPFSFFAKSLPLPGKANPVTRRDLLYYSNPKNRGYLALQQPRKGGRGGEPTGDEVIAKEVESREVKTGEAEAEELGRGEVEGTAEASREVQA